MYPKRALLSTALWLVASRGLQTPFTDQTSTTYSATEVKVPVVLGVMSQCPDAILCEAVFNRALEHVADIIDLSLTFIGRCVSIYILIDYTMYQLWGKCCALS